MVYDPSRFEARRRGISSQYAAESAMNEYARFLAQQRGSRQLGEFQRNVTQAVPKYGRTYGKRGLYGQGVNSGIFGQALSTFGEESARQRSQLESDIYQQQRQYELQGAGYLANYERALADLEGEKARLIGDTATGLLNLE